MSKYPYSRLTAEHFHAVDLVTCMQTLAESEIEHSVNMGFFTVHHGMRYGAPIVIVEHHNQMIDQLSGVWYDASCGTDRTPNHV